MCIFLLLFLLVHRFVHLSFLGFRFIEDDFLCSSQPCSWLNLFFSRFFSQKKIVVHFIQVVCCASLISKITEKISDMLINPFIFGEVFLYPSIIRREPSYVTAYCVISMVNSKHCFKKLICNFHTYSNNHSPDPEIQNHVQNRSPSVFLKLCTFHHFG